jgi:23S rRNA pseudouridine955/2504/2580 synthase
MKEFTISGADAGKSLFKVMKSLLPAFLNRDLFRLIRTKKIRVNSKKSRHDYILQGDDTIQCYLDDSHFKTADTINARKFQSVSSDIEILFEDDECLVVNKPSGLLVHSAGGKFQDNLVERVKAALYRRGEYDPGGLFHPAACNRLDRNTSGLVVFAKTHNALRSITGMFKQRSVEKEYLAVVHGETEKRYLLVSDMEQVGEGLMKAVNCRRVKSIPDKEHFISENPGKSVMVVEKVRSFTQKNYALSLVRVSLWTGSKHQVRVLMAASGNGLAGDAKYGVSNASRFNRACGSNGYLLHASTIIIPGKKMVKAGLPGYYRKFLLRSGFTTEEVEKL